MNRHNTEEQRVNLIAELTCKHANATRALIMTGNEKVLHDMANAVGDRLNENKNCELLVRKAVSAGPLAAGALFTALLDKCINADAECEAIREVERTEAAARTDHAEYLFAPHRRAVRDFAHNI